MFDGDEHRYHGARAYCLYREQEIPQSQGSGLGVDFIDH